MTVLIFFCLKYYENLISPIIRISKCSDFVGLFHLSNVWTPRSKFIAYEFGTVDFTQ